MLRRLVLAGAASAAALALLPAAGAPAATSRMESTFQDDAKLVYQEPAQQAATLDELKALGTDRIRVSVYWSLVAPSADSTQRPAFDATDPAAYGDRFKRYDDLVTLARARGIKVNFNVTSPVPRWAAGTAPRAELQKNWAPNAEEFGRFVTALGRRYTGSYVPAGASGPLPRVDYWTIWNEPNQPGWLTPQWQKQGSTFVEAAPALYRALVGTSWSALQSTGHGTDTILIGETAPKGLRTTKGESRAIDALRFVRKLYCVSDSLEILRGQAATAVGCPATGTPAQFVAANPGLFRMRGFAHHPYELNFAPSTPPRHPLEWVTIGNLEVLSDRLQRIMRRYSVARTRIPLYLTEFGYQTDPPDPTGVSNAKQARYLNEAEFIAWRNPLVRTMSQFLLFDDGPVPGTKRDLSTFQSGLRTASGTRKPSYDAYRLAFAVGPRASSRTTSFKVWGAVRTAAKAQSVRLEYRRAGSSRYRTLRTLRTRADGYLYRQVRLGSTSQLRLSAQIGGRTVKSRAQRVTVRR